MAELLSVDDQIFLSTRSVFSETRMQAKAAGIADDISLRPTHDRPFDRQHGNPLVRRVAAVLSIESWHAGF